MSECDDRRLMRAYLIGEFSTAADHLDALCLTAGEPEVDLRTAVAYTGTTLAFLTAYWTQEKVGAPFDPEEHPLERAIEEARAYCTEHMSRLDELLNRERARDERDEDGSDPPEGAAAEA